MHSHIPRKTGPGLAIPYNGNVEGDMARHDWLITAREAMTLMRVWIVHRTVTPLTQERPAVQSRTSEESAVEILSKQIEIQNKAGDALDLKLGTFFSIPTLLLPVAVALLIAERDNLDWLPGGYLAIGGTAAYIVVLSYLFRGYRSDVLFLGPKPDDLLRIIDTPAVRPADVQYFIADTLRKSYKTNEPLLTYKARMLTRALQWFLIQLFLYGAAVVVTPASGELLHFLRAIRPW